VLGSGAPVSNWYRDLQCLANGTSAAALALLALLAPMSLAVGAVEVADTESCPSRDATLAAVEALLGQSWTRRDERGSIEVVDLGSRFSVTVKGRTREYLDASRNCEQRARMAAVFVALTLAPPDITEPSEPVQTPAQAQRPTDAVSAAPAASGVSAPAPPPAAASEPAEQAGRTEWYVEFDLAAKVSFDPMQPRTDWGALARGVLGVASWGASLGIDVPTRHALEFDGTRVNASRYSVDLGLQRNWVAGALRASVELGPSLGWLRLQAARGEAEAVSRWLAGLHTGAYVTLANHGVSPFVGVDLRLVPYRIPITVEPRGEVGQTSMLWLGASLGVALTAD